MNQSRFERRPAKPTLHPRRVVGGVRLQARAAAAAGLASTTASAPTPATDQTAPAAATGWNWASARWMRLAETHAPGDQLAEGLEYARAGQTRSLEVKPGLISAKVQGRLPAAYKTALRLPTFTHEQWEAVINAVSTQAKYGASILAGELPADIEDLFAPQGLRLFPDSPADLSPSCTCAIFIGREPEPPQPLQPLGTPDIPTAPAPPAPPTPRPTPIPWCKHVCCLMYLTAERLGQQPLHILSLRGMAEADLVERLRQQRALAGLQRAGSGPAGPTPVYIPHVPRPPTSVANVPLSDTISEFWLPPDPGALQELDLPVAPPEVSHPLLRRLGPSPFAGARFPLVGLLATCYDVISQSAIRGEVNPPIAGDALAEAEPAPADSSPEPASY